MMRYSSMTNTVLLVIEILIVYYSVIYSVIFTWRTMTLSYTEISYNYFEKCSDFYTLSYASKSNRLYEDEECYYHPELEVFLLISYNLSNDYDNEIIRRGDL